MKRRLFLITVGLALALGVVLAQQNDQPRGDLYSTKAIQALEQCFDSAGVFICAPVGGGAAVGGSGTVDMIAKWTAATTLGDSSITDDGTVITLGSVSALVNVPPTLSGGSLLSLIATLNDPGAGNTVVGLDIDLNILAVESGNVFGLRIPTADSNDNTERGAALSIGDWSGGNPLVEILFEMTGSQNAEIVSNDGFTFITDFDNTPTRSNITWQPNPAAVSGSFSAYDFVGRVGTMDGSDVYEGIVSNMFQGTNPTGSDNEVRAFVADAITNRSGAVQASYFTETGYDYFSQMFAGTTTPPNPRTNSVGFYIDEGTDRTGGAGNDCVFVIRKSDGTEIDVAILTTDGGC